METSKGWEMSSSFQPPNINTSTSSLNKQDLREQEEVDEQSAEKSLKNDVEESILPNCGGSTENRTGDISLREWLDRPGRSVDQLECLHIFRQVAEAVSLAHSQSVVVNNIRPSCFVMTTFNRVSFIESASSSGSDDFPDQTLPMERAGAVESGVGGEKKNFPLKEILAMEFNWYTCPEEACGNSSTFTSDVYRLGVLLFELFCICGSLDEKLRTMSNLRHRVLPPELLLKWPKVASFCLWLLHPRAESRPKMSEVMKSEFFNATRDSLEDHEAEIRLREDIEDQGMLLEFLSQLQQRKKESADKLHDTISVISADIAEVVNQKLKTCSYSKHFRDEYSVTEKEYKPFLYATNRDSSCSSSRKRSRTGNRKNNEEVNENRAEGPISEVHSEIQEKFLSKSSRLMKNFKKLETAYFSSRSRLMMPEDKFKSRNFPVTRTGKGSTAKNEGSAADNLASKEGGNGRKCKWVDPFLEGLCGYLAFSKVKVHADLRQGDLMNSSNLVCSLAFDRDNDFFATAGVNRKIKIFECDMLLDDERDNHYPVVEMASISKLSSICWNSYIKSQIASSDFEGVVQVWDVTRSQVVLEMKEHEKRVWSVDFSPVDPTKLASGSDDGTIKLWNINQAGSIGSIRTKANVCSVQFPPDTAHSLAIGSADHNIYYYDLRNLRVPLCTLIGHTKTVSYVKFVDSSTLVSASTDSSLKLWDLSMNTSGVLNSPLETFTGHTNIKNFVGLSISDGYISTGSETNEVFVYHKAFPMPVLSYKFNSTDPISGREADDASQFVSCVCWRGQSSMLVAANSSGNIKILEMT